MIKSKEQKQALATIAFSNVGHTYSHLFTILYATAVLYLPKVFSIPYGELLGLSSVGLILFGVAALPAGWLGDRWSKIGMMVIYFFGIGIGAIFTGLADNTTTLFMGLTLIGLFASIYHPVGIAWIVAAAKKQGFTLGINGVFGNMGSALAPVFVGLMIDYVSWRAAFIIPGVLAIITGIGLLLTWRQGLVVERKTDRTIIDAPESSKFMRVFVILSITMACTGFVYGGLTNTMPKLFEDGLSKTLATSYTEIGIFVGVISGLASVSSVFGGWMADRYSARAIYVVFWLMQIPILLVIVTLTDELLLIGGLLILSFLLAFSAAENMLVAQYTPFRWRSLAYGAKFVLALGVGGLTVHLAGWLFDRHGDFGSLYFLFASAAFFATAAAIMLPGKTSSNPTLAMKSNM